MKRFTITFALAASIAAAQTPQTNSGPVLGFVAAPRSSQLQPILGIPGAARLGDPVALPNTVTQVFVAPGQAYALAAQGSAQPVALIVLRVSGVPQANPTLTSLPGALTNPDLVAFSPSAQSAALYSQATGRVQVFNGLPNSPRLAQQISNIADAVLLAVSDDAQVVLTSDGLGNAYSLAANAAPAPVYHTTEISTLAFVPQTHDAIICDPIEDTAVLIQAVSRIQLVASTSGCQFQGASATADGKTLLLACPAQRLIWSVDRASGSVDTHRVNNVPTGFNSLALPDTFVLSPADDAGVYWLVTWQGGVPNLSFIGARKAGAN